MALAALASDSPHGRLWATILQHRFGGSGALAGHPIGNLLLAGLNEVLADPVAALDELGRILGVKGRVLPMCPIALQIEADVAGLEADPRMSRVIRGQVAIATTPGKVRRVRLLPANPPATRQAVDAIMAADLVVLGRDRGSPASFRMCWCRDWPRRCRPPRPGARWCSTWWPSRERPRVSQWNVICTCSRSMRRTSPCMRSSSTPTGYQVSANASSCAALRSCSTHRSNSSMSPDLVHLYMIRASWPRCWTGCGCAAPRLTHARQPPHRCQLKVKGPAQRHRVVADREVTTRGDDGRSQRRTEPLGREFGKCAARRSHVAAAVRRGLHIVGGRVVIEAEVDLGSIARRLRKDIFELYGYNAVVHVLSASGIRKQTRYVLRVTNEGEALARQTGLLDQRGRPVRACRPSGGWQHRRRRSRLAGSLFGARVADRAGRSSSLEVSCPGPEAALALVGAARRLGVSAKAREVRGADRVVVRDGDAIGALLTRMGAQDTRLIWEERRMRREVRATANRLANFDDANLRRSARPRWRRRPEWSGHWRSSATACPTTWPRQASCASSTGRPPWKS
ncbi:putative sporulation transcription regulator whiA domain protein [Mycobacterium xenopi 4042]|uniref:Probable cell division protein WhiA n=1 Tax=Mycobacterium xenopi 4042 TaxID=1299334 RepID=X7YR70_MYCXE|nr:putative sporulation transcription regulator whiA domain protein [Mycobacterium xenopi 4042]